MGISSMLAWIKLHKAVIGPNPRQTGVCREHRLKRENTRVPARKRHENPATFILRLDKAPMGFSDVGERPQTMALPATRSPVEGH